MSEIASVWEVSSFIDSVINNSRWRTADCYNTVGLQLRGDKKEATPHHSFQLCRGQISVKLRSIIINKQRAERLRHNKTPQSPPLSNVLFGFYRPHSTLFSQITFRAFKESINFSILGGYLRCEAAGAGDVDKRDSGESYPRVSNSARPISGRQARAPIGRSCVWVVSSVRACTQQLATWYCPSWWLAVSGEGPGHTSMRGPGEVWRTITESHAANDHHGGGDGHCQASQH